MYTDAYIMYVERGEVQVEEMEGSRKPSSPFLFIEKLGNQEKSIRVCMHGCMFVCACARQTSLYFESCESGGH